MSGALQGNLDSFKLAEVLNFLSASRKTGMLTLTLAEREAYVFFRAGNVVYAASNHESLRLGPILLRKQKISSEQAEEIDDLMLRSGGRFGDIALQNGILTQEQLDNFLKIQVAEVIFDAFIWKSGDFSFFDGIDLPPNAVTISIDLPNLIMEGARRIDEWEECFKLLPDSSVVFRVVANPDSEKITLSLDEWKILFLINGQRTLEDLCQETDAEAFRVYRLVYGLYANKLIEPTAPRGEESEAAPTGPIGRIDDDTLRQSTSFGDATVREHPDDTSLLISGEATLSYEEVVKKTVAQVTIVNGENAGIIIPLMDNEYLIGRAQDNQIRLSDLGVSAHHARVFRGP